MAIKLINLILIVTILNTGHIDCGLKMGNFKNFTLRQRRSAAAADECDIGYKKNWWGTCVDINECQSSTADICVGAECVNTVGSYECIAPTTEATEPLSPSIECPDGYSKNWWGRCADIDECQEQNICGGDFCENTAGSYKCIPKKEETNTHCQEGFFYNIVTEKCEDIDECSMEMDNCMEYMCENTIGSFRCIDQPCYPGFEHTTAGCQDVDECKKLGDAACSNDEVCHNVKSGFVCQKCILGDNELQCYQRKQCPPGSEPSKLPFNICTDIDECKRGFHRCSDDEQCVNTIPGYRCECRRGLTRNLKNQCMKGHHNCGIDNVCPDVTKQVPCLFGFRLTNDRLKCEDIDECAEDEHNCAENRQCHNFRGGYRCYVKLI